MEKKPNKKGRSADYYRHHRERVINRKYNIRKELWGSKVTEDYYDHEDGGKAKGTLSKGKIHCSCPMCKGHCDYEEKISNQKKIRSVEEAIKDYYEFD